MTTVRRQLATFALVLAGLYGVGLIAGQIIDPEPPHAGDSTQSGDEANAMNDMTHNKHTAAKGAGHQAAAAPVRGLAITENGLRVVVDDPELHRGREGIIRFRIVDEKGGAVRDFDVEHEKRMHLIVARRDLTGFQHLHPRMSDDGTWSAPVVLDEAGSYRLFADFSHRDKATTLASDLRVDGTADLKALPAPTTAARSDGGYDVRLDTGDVVAGREATLGFTISRDRETVQTEPYLGAGGHLVALREGDLAFLHVHPTGPESGHGDANHDDAGQGSGVGFAVAFPTHGRYRLFLQFRHEGVVQTVAFTQEVKRR